LTLPTGVIPASDIFQGWVVHLFDDKGKNKPYPYIEDKIHFKGKTFEEQMAILHDLKLLAKIGMQVSTKKSCFCQEVLEYLGFLFIQTSYTPLPS
jgi:hypothetical protein